MKQFLHFLDSLRMPRPEIWGTFHLICLLLAAGTTVLLYIDKKRGGRISPRTVFGVYGFGTFLLELTKQLMWAVVETEEGLDWSYSWYSAPFQFCTMPLYISLILFFTKNKALNEYLLSFLGLYAVLSMTAVMCMPGDVFTESVIINVHTMYLHGGGLVLSLFVLTRRLIHFTLKSILKGYAVFLVCTAMALAMDIGVELSEVNDGETFNMFYISPYYESTLPVFSSIWHKLPYPLFLLTYTGTFFAGGCLSCGIARCIAGKKKMRRAAV